MPKSIQKKVEEILWANFDGGDNRLMGALLSLYGEASAACGNDGSIFIDDLLRRYTYVSHETYDEGIESIATHIAEEFDLSKTCLCATTADHQKDSAQRVLYDVATILGSLGHTKITTLNRYDRILKHSGNAESVILVDEFVGTGRSIIGRANAIRRTFQSKSITPPKIYVYVLAGMDFGLRKIAPTVDAAYPFIALKPGIRGFIKDAALHRAYQLLDRLEQELAATIDDQVLPKRGDGECEALYARKKGNCPNSVLPVFWWPRRVDGSRRLTAFSRTF